MDSFLIFDIETVPDIESGASILGLTNLSDEEVIKAMEHTKFQKAGNTVQPNHLQKIICISVIFKKFNEDPEYYMLKYNRGIDQFLYENIEYKTYDKVCYSIKDKEYDEEDTNYNICLFNQRKILMEDGWSGWWKKYFIPSTS